MSGFKLTIELTQYTPLLHFQGDQSGACLRASEVKPKLDRFVMSWLVKHCDNIPLSWSHEDAEGEYIENAGEKVRRTSLRYRMSFRTEAAPLSIETNMQIPPQRGGKPRTIKKIHALYFGAMGDENFGPDRKSKVKAVTYSDMSMDILCMVQGEVVVDGKPMTLIQVLNKLIPPFFALHCFGTRSNKGFGSFGVAKINGEQQGALELHELREYTPDQMLYYVRHKASDPKAFLDTVAEISEEMRKEKKRDNRKKWLNTPIALVGAYKDGNDQKRFSHPIHFKPHGAFIFLIPQPIPKAVLNRELTREVNRRRYWIKISPSFRLTEFMNALPSVSEKKIEKVEATKNG